MDRQHRQMLPVFLCSKIACRAFCLVLLIGFGCEAAEDDFVDAGLRGVGQAGVERNAACFG